MNERQDVRVTGTLVATTIKTSMAILGISLIAVGWLSSGATRPASGGRFADPATTGSLTRDAGTTRLDPCAVPLRR